MILDIIIIYILADCHRKIPRAAPRTNIIPGSNDCNRNPTYENVNEPEGFVGSTASCNNGYYLAQPVGPKYENWAYAER